MLRDSKITPRAAAALLSLALLWAKPAAALGFGQSCNPSTTNGFSADATGNNWYCNGNTSTITYPAYWFGSTSTGCSSTTAGIVQWTGSLFEGCNGTAWGSLGSGWSGSSAFSSLLAATTTNSINNSSYAQTWAWNGLSTQTALSLSSTSETSGTILSVAASNAAATGYAGYFSQSGTGTAYGVYATEGGAANTGYAGYFSNTSTGGYALYVNGTIGGAIVSGEAAPITGTVAVTAGGTGLTSGNSGGIPYFSGSTSMGSSAALTQYGVVYGGGAGSAPAATAAGTTGQVLVANTGAAPSWGTAASALSGLLAATTTNKIDSGSWAQTWEWGTLSSGTALTLTTSSMTGGTLLSLQNTAAAATATGDVLAVSNASTGAGYGVYSAATGAANSAAAGYFANTATSGTNYAVYASNVSGSGYGGYFSNTATSGVALWCSSSYPGGCGGNEGWSNSSDIRLKDGVTDFPAARGLDDVMKLRPVLYHWKDKKRDQRQHAGLIAQEVEPLYPEVVASGPDGMKSIEYGALVFPVIKAMQQQQKILQQQQAEIEELRAEIAALREQDK